MKKEQKISKGMDMLIRETAHQANKLRGKPVDDEITKDIPLPPIPEVQLPLVGPYSMYNKPNHGQPVMPRPLDGLDLFAILCGCTGFVMAGIYFSKVWTH